MIWEEFMLLSDTQQAVPCQCCRVPKVFKAEEAWITFAFDHRREGQRLQIAVKNYFDDKGWANLGEAPAAGEQWTRRVLLKLLDKMLEDQEDVWGRCWRIMKSTIDSDLH